MYVCQFDSVWEQFYVYETENIHKYFYLNNSLTVPRLKPSTKTPMLFELVWGGRLNESIFFLVQVFDAGEVFGIMHVEDEEDEDNPQAEMGYKVIVTRESDLQAADPTR